MHLQEAVNCTNPYFCATYRTRSGTGGSDSYREVIWCARPTASIVHVVIAIGKGNRIGQVGTVEAVP
jgi:hypothetical protein